MLGEYAVLDGGPALVAAVDRGVMCTVTDGDAIETPGDDSFVRAALRTIGAPRARYHFEDWNPTELPGKGGFGGSAAAVVAACIAGGCEDVETMVAIHRSVQGSGSGMDVRASASGGIRRYQRASISEALPGVPLLAVWSGNSARTGPRVERYLAHADREDFVRRSVELVDGFSQDPVASLEAAFENLVAMSERAGIDYLTPGHRRIAELARAQGGAAKPSGAGGGDVAVALFASEDSRRDFARACALEGLLPVPVRIIDGVHDA